MIFVILIIFFVLLLFSVPIAFSLGLSLVPYFLIENITLEVLVQRIVAGLNSFPLMALPLFILAGDLMGVGSVTKRLLALAQVIVHKMTGGLAIANIMASTLFGAISGSAAATSAAIGGVLIPEMKKEGYSNGFIGSLQGSAGTLGLIIPPSIAMVILGVTGGISIGDLFLAGFIPGIILAIILAIYSYFIVKKGNYRTKELNSNSTNTFTVIRQALLPLLSPFIVLGGIFSGIVTPTESAVLAVVYALILSGIIYKELTLKNIYDSFARSSIVSASIMIIIGVASGFSWILTSEQIPGQLAEFFLSSLNNTIYFFIILSLIIFLLGTVMEAIALIVLLTPIFIPLVHVLGIDPIHFGIVMIVNLAIAGVTPPVGLSLITACKIADINIEDTFPEIIHIIGLMLLVLALIILVPQFSTFLPNIVGD